MKFTGQAVEKPFKEILLSISHPKHTKMKGFESFWAWHITGFNDGQHCQHCFLGKREDSVNKDMDTNSKENPLVITMTGDYFYICGVSPFEKSTSEDSEYYEKQFSFPAQMERM